MIPRQAASSHDPGESVPRARPGLGPRAWQRVAGLTVVATLVAGCMALAQESTPSTAPPPEFFIERITVESARTIAPEIIVSESLLKEGRRYTERELSEAVHRIVRLPLVLGADFALRRGTERGRYELVITVEESERWLVGLEITHQIGEDLRGLPGLEPLSGEDALPDGDHEDLLLGWRTGLGRYGVLGAAVDPFDGGSVEVGYTHYDLLHRSIQLSLNLLFAPVDGGSDYADTRQGRLDLGIPLRGNHSILVSSSFRSRDWDFLGRPGADWSEDRWVADASWVFNTLDDPVFPASGSFVRAGVGYRRIDVGGLFVSRRSDGSPIHREVDSRQQDYRLFLVSDRYWQLSRKQSISASLDLAVGRSNTPLVEPDGFTSAFDIDVWRAEAAVGYDRFLLRSARPKWRELRWETELGVFHEGSSPDFDLPWNPRTGIRLSSGLGFRTRWGVFRYLLNFIETSE